MSDESARARTLTHVEPGDVPLQVALDALADPVRRSILRDLAAHDDWTRACGTFDLPVTKATRRHAPARARRLAPRPPRGGPHPPRPGPPRARSAGGGRRGRPPTEPAAPP